MPVAHPAAAAAAARLTRRANARNRRLPVRAQPRALPQQGPVRHLARWLLRRGARARDATASILEHRGPCGHDFTPHRYEIRHNACDENVDIFEKSAHSVTVEVKRTAAATINGPVGRFGCAINGLMDNEGIPPIERRCCCAGE